MELGPCQRARRVLSFASLRKHPEVTRDLAHKGSMMRSFFPRHIVGSCVLGCLIAAGPAYGSAAADCASDEICASQMKQGKQAHNDKRYAQALRLYAAAYAGVADPTLLVLMGRTHFKQGTYAQALELYRLAQPRITLVADQLKLREYIDEAEQAQAALSPPRSPPAPSIAEGIDQPGQSAPSAEPTPRLPSPPPASVAPTPIAAVKTQQPAQHPVAPRKRIALWIGVGIAAAATVSIVLGLSLGLYARPPDWPDAITLMKLSVIYAWTPFSSNAAHFS